MYGWCELQAILELELEDKRVGIKFENHRCSYKLSEQEKFVGSLLKRQWEFDLDQEHHPRASKDSTLSQQLKQVAALEE
jgi:hypothetical protein